MTSKRSTRFKFIKRGKGSDILMVPGWATDSRIFEPLDLELNYILPEVFYPANFEKELLGALEKRKINKISILGFSLGGFLAADFASKHADMIDKLILIGIRKRYDKGVLQEIKKLLKKNKKGYLYKFYSQCFASGEDMRWFRKNLLKTYCNDIELDHLIETLDHLGKSEIDPEALSSVNNIKIIHGEKDLIAPFSEAVDIKEALPQAELACIKEAGHMAFLSSGAEKYI